MDIVVANGFVMECCTFFSREYHCCVLHNTRCKCEDYNPLNSKPITNADRIRSLSDEELAKWIESLEPNKCPSDDWFDRCETWTCKGCFLNWLKTEANDDKR